MYFYIRQNSELPSLQMELIHNGLKGFNKFSECIQNADIYFFMYNKDTKIFKVANAKAYIKPKDMSFDCTEEYLICYDWKKRDTKEKGNYIGYFSIVFSEDIVSEIDTYPKGELIMPIREELNIVIE